MEAKGRSGSSPRIGVVTEPLVEQPLVEVMDWLVRDVPEVTDLEIGTGGYAPTNHCDMTTLLRDAAARKAWVGEINARGLRVAALNAWGNPLHPDTDTASRHDSDLRDTIRLAAALGVDRVVALAGCPAGVAGDRVPHFAGGGWLPYLEAIYDAQWESSVEPYWSGLAGFARREHPQLRVCLELHPGTVVYNVETFNRIARLGESIAANIDPSHFMWMGMDAIAVVAQIGERAAHCHGKDVAFSPANLAVNGLLDHRWPRPPAEMPWNFAVVGRGKDQKWWSGFIAALIENGTPNTVAIEHEDPFAAPKAGIGEAAAVLTRAVKESGASATRP